MKAQRRGTRAALLGACIGVLMLGASACQALQRAVDGVAIVKVPLRDSGASADTARARVFELRPAEQLVVELAAHGGTGYSWELAGPAPAILLSEGLPTTTAAGEARAGTKSAASVAGGPTWTTYRFRALAQGEGVVRFVLRRPWEPAGVRADQVDISVTIKPSN